MPTRNVSDLRPHPENARIYADAPTPDLVESVRGRGVLQPLLITQDGRVISGHRRLAAALEAGLAEVPVSVFASADELDILQALVESNRQRTKTNEQLGREADALLRIEGERAKRRQQEHGGTAPGKAKTLPENFPEVSGEARDKVGEALGLSGRKAEQAAAVARVIDRLEAAGQEEEAAGLRRALNQSVNAAYTLCRENGYLEPKAKPKGKAGSNGKATKGRKKKTPVPPPLYDALGRVVPDRLRDAFGDRTLPDALAEVERWAESFDPARLVKHLRAVAPHYPYLRLASNPHGRGLVDLAEAAAEDAALLAETLRAGLADVVCTGCRGEGCDLCRRSGHLPLWRHEELKAAGHVPE